VASPGRAPAGGVARVWRDAVVIDIAMRPDRVISSIPKVCRRVRNAEIVDGASGDR
jgi:hypothetical protein